ncbi:MAG: CHAT domain-containing protein [Blautia sp.]|nr:CHAT domain-containing protein [Blautia sp.]
MDEGRRQAIIEAKDKWLTEGNIAGAAVCNFLLMKDRGLDIIYDAENELVKEYCELLQKRLETNNKSLVLMVSTEIERCLIDEKEELYQYLSDEIYEHFQNGGKEYPIQAVGFHIHAVATLFYLDYAERGSAYMRIIRDTQREVFGDDSFLFCQNWCYIINEALYNVYPDIAIIEFDKNVDLFARVLKEEDVLYQLCLNIAVAKMKQEQNADYLKQAVDLCETWCRDIPIGLQKEKRALIRRATAMNYRNIGEIDTAIEKFWEEVHLSKTIQDKLEMLCQIASMLFTKHDLSAFPRLFEEGKKLIADVQEPDKYVAGFYHFCGLYCMEKWQYDEAQVQFDKAISINEQLMDSNADDIVKIKYYKLINEYEMGKLNEVREQLKQLYQTICKNVEYYPQSFPLVFNGLLMLNLESNINSADITRMKNKLTINPNQYDLPSVLLFKCNLYCLMMAGEDIYDRDDWEPMQKELKGFFDRYPYAEGSLQYLKGEYYRCLKEGDSSSVSGSIGKILDKMEACFADIPCINSISYFQYYLIKLRNLLYKEEYAAAARQLSSMWKSILMPLFETLSHMEEDRSEDIFGILHSYASLFVSTVQQYPQLRIKSEELYELVLNVKYLEDLFYCRRQEFCFAVEQRRWVSVKDINISREDLIIECFDYIRKDMKNLGNMFRVLDPDSRSLDYRIYFGIQHSSGIFSKRIVEVVDNVPFMALHKQISNLYDLYDMENVSEIEQGICSKLRKFLYQKKRIFFCYSDWQILMPLAFIRINPHQYWGDIYQIIYCNTAMDIKSDIRIENLSDSIFFGMSEFDGDRESRKLHKGFNDLPYAGLEVEVLGGLTGGSVYLNEKKPKEWFDGKKAEIIHFATHTMQNQENDSISLIIEKDEFGSYRVLQDKDIGKMDWKGVKLIVFSGCETGGEAWEESGKHSLRLAAKKAGTLFSISTWAEIDDGTGSFFMVCFYKNLLRHREICKAFFETQKMMRSMTKKEILNDDDYVEIGMEFYLQNIEEDARPFDKVEDWAFYLLQMN